MADYEPRRAKVVLGPVQEEHRESLKARVHSYASLMVNYHWDNGNVGRHMAWSIVDIFTRRKEGDFMPSLK